MTDTSTRKLHQQADRLLNSNRIAEARALYDEICILDSNDAEAFMMLGALNGEMGNIEDALKSLNEALRIDPGYADAYHTLAYLLRHQDKLAEARTALQKAVEIDPDFTEAWIMLSGVLGQLGDYTGVEAASRRALRLDPTLVDARANLANALVEQDKNEAAIPELKRVTAQQPANAPVWSRLGAILIRLERFDEAIPALETAIRLNPSDSETQTLLACAYDGNKESARAIGQLQQVLERNPDQEQVWATLTRLTEADGWQALADFCERLAERCPSNRHIMLNHAYALEKLNNLDGACAKYEQIAGEFSDWGEGWNRLGLLHMRLEHYQLASGCLKKAIDCGVGSPLALCMYGSVLRIEGDLKKAEYYCRQAMEKAPDIVPTYIHLGMVQTMMGEYERALETYHKGLELDPDNLALISGISDVLERQGHIEKACQLLEPYLDLDHDGIVYIASMYAKVSNCLKRGEQALELVEKTLAREDVMRGGAMDLHFRAGDIYHSMRQYDNAIDHYHKANALSELEFDRDGHVRFIDEIIATFNEDALAFLENLGNPSARPIFIVGMPRSGTSLAEQILASHPDVFGAGELLDFPAVVQNLRLGSANVGSLLARLASLNSKETNRYAEAYLKSIDTPSNAERYVTDKMPYNFLHLGLVQLLFPNARVIHTRRDPMDSCLSCYFLAFVGTHPHAYGLEDLGVYYREYERLMAHWHDVLSIPILDVQYEEAVEDIEATCRRMIEFCGLDWDDRVLDFHQSDRVVRTASYDQVRRPAYKSSVGRWKPYESWLDPLKQGLSG